MSEPNERDKEANKLIGSFKLGRRYRGLGWETTKDLAHTIMRMKEIEARLAPAPPEARQDEALLRERAFVINGPGTPGQCCVVLLADALAALRARQSATAADRRDLFSGLRKLAGNLKIGDPAQEESFKREGLMSAAAPQPSPQGEDAVYQSGRNEATPADLEYLEEILTDAWADQYLIGPRSDVGLLRTEVKRLRARLASERKDTLHWCGVAGAHTKRILDLEARLASSQSSAQGEEARDDEPLSYMNRAELQLNIMRNIEREIKNLSRDNEGDEGFSLRYWWNKTANWAKVQRILNGNTHKAGSTSSTEQCRFIGADPDGYSFAEARAALERKEGE